MYSSKKDYFSLPDDIRYLNSAYMSPQLKSVETIGIENLKRKNLPYTITSDDFFTDQVLLKKRFAQLVAIEDPQHVAIIPSVSYGMANVAQNVRLKRGDEILIVNEQFPSNVYVWQKVAKQYGAKIRVVEPHHKFEHRGEKWNHCILDAITSKTAVVTMCHVHWADGTLFDLKTIREKSKNVNALLILDGTQSIGALPFSVQDIQPDALICGGYKWLLGPYALGLAYYGDYFNNGTPIEEGWLNRKHSQNFSSLTEYQSEYLPKSWRYSMGESSNFILVPMLTKAIEQLLEWKPEYIQDYCHTISKDAIKVLRKKGCFIETKDYRAKHLFGIYLPETLDMVKIKKRLAEKQIYISQRGQSIRVSSHLHNTQADFEALISCF